MKEAEGYKLHLSSRSATGYLGVYWNTSADRFIAHYKQQHVGCFATAVEAAVAYAKEVAADATAEVNDVDDPCSTPGCALPAIHSEPSALGRGKRKRSEVDYNAGHEAIEEHLESARRLERRRRRMKRRRTAGEGGDGGGGDGAAAAAFSSATAAAAAAAVKYNSDLNDSSSDEEWDIDEWE